jgi:hypothetical protein
MEYLGNEVADQFADRKIKLAVCLPGSSFRQCFLTSYTQLIAQALMKGWLFMPIFARSSDIYQARNSCLGRPGPGNEPFENKIPYTHILWIDSDQEFKFTDVENLIAADKEVIAGWYCGNNSGETTTVVEKSKVYKDFFKNKIEPIKIKTTGFGFLLMKKGVLEKMPWPWFTQRIDPDAEIKTPASEDVSFCLNLKDAGIDVWVHPFVHVGHDKSNVIY